MTFTCDTSVLVPAMANWHPASAAMRSVLDEHHVTAAAAHVMFECYSVLTRMPHDQQVRPAIAGAALDALGWTPISLSGDEQAALISRCAAANISGGAVYDALVGETARRHGMTLLTSDQRARRTYEALGVAYALV